MEPPTIRPKLATVSAPLRVTKELPATRVTCATESVPAAPMAVVPEESALLPASINTPPETFSALVKPPPAAGLLVPPNTKIPSPRFVSALVPVAVMLPNNINVLADCEVLCDPVFSTTPSPMLILPAAPNQPAPKELWLPFTTLSVEPAPKVSVPVVTAPNSEPNVSTVSVLLASKK